MQKYIVLLRGVNVGDKNKISMPLLKTALEAQGLSNVVTYINSGNILFDSDLNKIMVRDLCENVIETSFGLKIKVNAILAEELCNAIGNAPKWWNEDADSKHNAIFEV